MYGHHDDLLHFARQVPIDEVIIALPLDAERRLKALCDKIKALAIDVRLSVEPLAETFQCAAIGLCRHRSRARDCRSTAQELACNHQMDGR